MMTNVVNFEQQPLTYENLVEKGKQIVKKQATMNWDIGDLAVDVATEYSESSLSQYAEDIGIEYVMLRDFRTTARAWPQKTQRRVFSICRALNPHPDRFKIAAENPDLTVRQAYALIKTWRMSLNNSPREGNKAIERVPQLKHPQEEPKEQIWSPERDAKLMQLTKQGLTDPQIAKEMHTTDGAISGRRVRINFKTSSPADHRLPLVMPDDVLLQALEHIRAARTPLFQLKALSTYAEQMHDDTKHRIAEEVEVFYSLSRDIIKRLVGGIQEIKPVTCGVELKVRKED